MGYKLDPRKQLRAMEKRIAEGADDAQTTRNMQMVLTHMIHEGRGDFDALMATVSPKAAYTSFASGINSEHSPRSKEAVGKYYGGIVAADCHRIEHDIDRIVADRYNITTEGTIRMAYPAAVLNAMGIPVPDTAPYYMHEARLLVVWGFDEDGLVSCEDSYSVLDGFAGIADRPLQIEDIYDVTKEDA